VIAGDFNLLPSDEFPSDEKNVLANSSGRMTRTIATCLRDLWFFSEVVINGPSRVQRLDGYPDHWSQLDRVMIRAPEADVGDSRPTAKALYESRLATGKVSDHVPIGWETFPDHFPQAEVVG